MKRHVFLFVLALSVASPAALAGPGTNSLAELASFADISDTSRLSQTTADAARRDLDDLIARPPRSAQARTEAVQLATALLPRLLRARVQPHGDDGRFTVWKPTDASQMARGGNPILRADIATFAADARRLNALFSLVKGADPRPVTNAQLHLMVLLARYRTYIASNWSVSATTAAAFDAARSHIARALVDKALRQAAAQASWSELATLLIPSDRGASPAPAPAAPARVRDNPYLIKVDEAIADPQVRRAIRAAQPAAVKIGGGSGVNIAPAGLVLTNAHVAKVVGKRFTAIFPDGRELQGRTIAVDERLDLALVQLDPQDEALPTARIARSAPAIGTAVIVIGNPGTTTPDGQPTGYQRFHVSTGAVRSVASNPLGSQSLGGIGHDAWTYWGHSGSPLFNEGGAVVALHNSWDSTTAMRHAVTWQGISAFLTANQVAGRR